jgi:hypothetical protein
MDIEKIDDEKLWFLVFITNAIATIYFDNERRKAYQILEETDTLRYLVDCFNTLHTQSPEYVIENVEEILKSKGVLL